MTKSVRESRSARKQGVFLVLLSILVMAIAGTVIALDPEPRDETSRSSKPRVAAPELRLPNPDCDQHPASLREFALHNVAADNSLRWKGGETVRVQRIARYNWGLGRRSRIDLVTGSDLMRLFLRACNPVQWKVPRGRTVELHTRPITLDRYADPQQGSDHTFEADTIATVARGLYADDGLVNWQVEIAGRRYFTLPSELTDEATPVAPFAQWSNKPEWGFCKVADGPSPRADGTRPDKALARGTRVYIHSLTAFGEHDAREDDIFLAVLFGDPPGQPYAYVRRSALPEDCQAA